MLSRLHRGTRRVSSRPSVKRRREPVVNGEQLGGGKWVSERLTDIGRVAGQGGGELVGHGCCGPGKGQWTDGDGCGREPREGKGTKCRDEGL